jgi:hypothetical protein
MSHLHAPTGGRGVYEGLGSSEAHCSGAPAAASSLYIPVQVPPPEHSTSSRDRVLLTTKMVCCSAGARWTLCYPKRCHSSVATILTRPSSSSRFVVVSCCLSGERLYSWLIFLPTSRGREAALMWWVTSCDSGRATLSERTLSCPFGLNAGRQSPACHVARRASAHHGTTIGRSSRRIAWAAGRTQISRRAAWKHYRRASEPSVLRPGRWAKACSL